LERIGYVYHVVFIRPTDQGEFHYIGQHRKATFDKKYRGSGLLLQGKYKKYGKEHSTVSVICWASTQEELNNKEIHFIKEAKRIWGASCLNLNYGGANGSMSESTKRKIGKANSGKVHTAEHRAKVGAAGKGRVVSEETRRKLSIANKGRPNPHTDLEALQRGAKAYRELCKFVHGPKKDRYTGMGYHRVRWFSWILGHVQKPSIHTFKALGIDGHFPKKAKVIRKASAETKARMSASQKRRYALNPAKGIPGKKWYNDGTNSFMLFQSDPRAQLLKKGRIILHRSTKEEMLARIR
jgi:hypothetical protein